MFDRQPVRVLARVSLVMLFVGIGIGLISLLTWEWIEAAVIPEIDDIQEQVVEGYTPLAFLIIAAVTAPVLAGILGIFEGLRMDERRTAVFIAVGCFIGAALLVFVAGIFIGMTGPETDEEGPVGALDLISLAGLSGLVSVLSGALTAVFGSK